MKNTEFKILFFGDITGKPGRLSVMSYLNEIYNSANKPDFVIANIENASHGFGLTKKNYQELQNAGINCMTSGNHIWDKKDIYEYIEDSEILIRPINYPKNIAGVGSRIFDIKGEKFGIISALGRVFMPPTDSPWMIVVDEIERLKTLGAEHIFIDFHAEATAEKICFSKYLANRFNTEKNALIKGFWGTHTHVQTADEQLYLGMSYITDVGFCGASDGVIGMDYETSLKRLSTSLPERYDVARGNISQINGVEVLINKTSATQIKRINVSVYNKENEKEVQVDTGG